MKALLSALADRPLPLAFIDEDALELNVAAVLAPIRAHGKKLRIATKSIRAPELMKRLAAAAGDSFIGWMTYSVRETEFLASLGFDELLIAYPTASRLDAELLAELTAKQIKVSIVADDEEQLIVLERAAQARNIRLAIIAEVDTSYRPLGDNIHVGVRRSPLHDPNKVVEFCERIARSPHLEFRGLMGYEAHIAGLTDHNPFSPLMNAPKRAMKSLARPSVKKLRAEIAAELKRRNIPVQIFNGGGSGSLGSTSEEDAVTEVTAGSGFLCSHLFDYYEGSPFRPAAFFALQAVRRPAENMITCHGGGYIASGEAGADRLPVVHYPAGATLLGLEGAGEVQTPVVLPKGVQVPLGAPVIFRHAKAGELAEHFDEYLLVRGDQVSGRTATYRGLGKNFLG